MRKKLLVTATLALVVVIGGGFYLKHEISKKLSAQVVSILSEKSTQNEIHKLVQEQSKNPALVDQILAHAGTAASGNSKSTESSNNVQGLYSKDTGTSSTGLNGSTSSQSSGDSTVQGQSSKPTSTSQSGTTGPVLRDRSDVVSYAMSHFSAGEIAHYMSLYAEKQSLSPEQKAQIKQQILSHFTPQELAAMAAAVNK